MVAHGRAHWLTRLTLFCQLLPAHFPCPTLQPNIKSHHDHGIFQPLSVQTLLGLKHTRAARRDLLEKRQKLGPVRRARRVPSVRVHKRAGARGRVTIRPELARVSELLPTTLNLPRATCPSR